MALSLATGLVFSGCRAGDRPSTAYESDILVITVDTARADRYSFAFRSSPVVTSVADGLADDGAAFLCAVAPSPITLVSHASLFTGQTPPDHGVRNNGEFVLMPVAVTLAEVLAGQGWETAAFIGAAVLEARYGLDQGFATYDDNIDATDAMGMFSHARRTGDVVVGAALRWLESRGPGRTFVWVHLYDPHAPYQPPEPEKSLYGDPYDGAIAYADRVVGELLDGYRRAGRLDNTLVVLTSDHGESLGEHGENTHGVFIYDATVRVPLLMSGPGVKAGTRIDRPVALVDVMPTILGLVGVSVPPSVTGRDLGPLLKAAGGVERGPIYVESLLPELSYGWSPLRGLRTERWKFIQGVAPELYDLGSDPAERANVAVRFPQVVLDLSTALDGAGEGSSGATARRVEVDSETRSRLAALGYHELPRVMADGEDKGRLPDPRERIATMEKMYAAMTRFAQGDSAGAIAALDQIAAAEPTNLAAAFNLAQLRFRVADYPGAAEAYLRAAKLAPAEAKYLEFAGLAFERSQRLEEALQAYEQALVVEPGRSGARSLRWRLLGRLGRRDELLHDLENAVSEDPSNGAARAMLVRARYGNEPSDAFVEAAEAALAEIPGDTTLSAMLGHAYLARGQSERAEPLLRRVLEAVPGDQNASLAIGRLALGRGDLDEARRVLEAGVRKHPDQVVMQVEVARTRILSGDLESAGQALAAAYRLDPRSPDLWLASAEMRLREGRWNDAARDLERAVALGGHGADFQRRVEEVSRKLPPGIKGGG